MDAGDYGEPRVKERRDAPAGVDERDVPPFPTLSSALAQAQAQATAAAAAAGRMDAVDEDERTADDAHLGRTGGKRVRHEDDDKEQQQHRSAHPHSTGRGRAAAGQPILTRRTERRCRQARARTAARCNTAIYL